MPRRSGQQELRRTSRRAEGDELDGQPQQRQLKSRAEGIGYLISGIYCLGCATYTYSQMPTRETCINHSCGKAMDFTTLVLLGPSVSAKLPDLKVQNLEKSGALKRCINPRCNGGSTQTSRAVCCSLCGDVWCTTCSANHTGMTCEQHAESLARPTINPPGSPNQPCPFCVVAVWISWDAGCDLMTCPTCRSQLNFWDPG